jgi:DNA-directed RNA polymerase subunit A"
MNIGEVEVQGEDKIIIHTNIYEINKLQKIKNRIMNTKVKGVKGVHRVIVRKEKNEYVVIHRRIKFSCST